MQVVIDIDDKLYNRIKCLEPKSNTMLDGLMRSVQNGTPLPRGHGRLIDESKITKCYMLPINRIDVRELRTDAPTIIEPESE